MADSCGDATVGMSCEWWNAAGDVMMELSVLPSGVVEDTSIRVVMSAGPYFDRPLKSAIAKWQFMPFEEVPPSRDRRIVMIYEFRQDPTCTSPARKSSVWRFIQDVPLLTVVYCPIPWDPPQ